VLEELKDIESVRRDTLQAKNELQKEAAEEREAAKKVKEEQDAAIVAKDELLEKRVVMMREMMAKCKVQGGGTHSRKSRQKPTMI